MSGTITINVAAPIASVKILNNYGSEAERDNHGGVSDQEKTILGVNAEPIGALEDSESQKAVFSQSCRTLQGLIEKLNQVHEKMIIENKEEIAKLSVEIARKVLSQKVKEGDYEIESIIKKALESAPTRQGLVVHLNPEDLGQYQQAQQDSGNEELKGVELIADSGIGRAECLVETSKGIVESLINGHLEQIGHALKKAE